MIFDHIDDKRLVFITSKYSYNSYNSLYFIIIDLFNNYDNFIIRSYKFDNIIYLILILIMLLILKD